MPILIDGYNLLSEAGITGHGEGRGYLQRSRLALLNFLETVLDPDDARNTIVVFDAHHPPPGLPRIIRHGAITVRYASDFQDADALIELLIRSSSAPRRLVVVSSDHRIQRAARRRRATAVDSEPWYFEMLARWRGAERRRRENRRKSKPRTPLPPEEIQRWLERFGGEASLQAMIEEAEAILRRETTEDAAARRVQKKGRKRPAKGASARPNETPPTPRLGRKKKETIRRPPREETDEAIRPLREEGPYGPFPPQYIEEILRELRQSRGEPDK